MFPRFQSLGGSIVLTEVLNIINKGLAITAANSLRTVGYMRSGPGSSHIVNLCNTFSINSSLILISSSILSTCLGGMYQIILIKFEI